MDEDPHEDVLVYSGAMGWSTAQHIHLPLGATNLSLDADGYVKMELPSAASSSSVFFKPPSKGCLLKSTLIFSPSSTDSVTCPLLLSVSSGTDVSPSEMSDLCTHL